MREYWITHVRMKDKKIEYVKAFIQTIEGLSNPSMYARNTLIQNIDNNDKCYICLLKEKQGARNIWTIKGKIHVIEVDGEKYIRADNNKIKKDNLGELPSF